MLLYSRISRAIKQNLSMYQTTVQLSNISRIYMKKILVIFDIIFIQISRYWNRLSTIYIIVWNIPSINCRWPTSLLHTGIMTYCFIAEYWYLAYTNVKVTDIFFLGTNYYFISNSIVVELCRVFFDIVHNMFEFYFSSSFTYWNFDERRPFSPKLPIALNMC